MSRFSRLEHSISDLVYKGEQEIVSGVNFIERNKDSINAGISAGFNEAGTIIQDVEHLGSQAASPITNFFSSMFKEIKLDVILGIFAFLALLYFLFPYFKEGQKTTRAVAPEVIKEAGNILPMAAPLFI